MTNTEQWTCFEGLPDQSNIWIHGFSEPLSEAAVRLVEESLGSFFPTWTSHGSTVDAGFVLIEKRFLVTAAFCSTGLSGCGIDAYFRVLKELRDHAGIDALQAGLVFHRTPVGEIRSTQHLDFFDLVERGEVTPETPVFDTMIDRLGDLRQCPFQRPFLSAWHHRTYGGVVRPGGGDAPGTALNSER